MYHNFFFFFRFWTNPGHLTLMLSPAELPGQLPQQRRDGVCGSLLLALPDGHRLPTARLPGAGPADGADIWQLLPQVTEFLTDGISLEEQNRDPSEHSCFGL